MDPRRRPRPRDGGVPPWGTTIAHGFLTLSPVPHFRRQIVEIRGVSRIINYGVDRVRFPNAVKTGARVRGGQTRAGSAPGRRPSRCSRARGRTLLTAVRATPGAVRFTSRFVIENESKPACVADTVSLVYV